MTRMSTRRKRRPGRAAPVSSASSGSAADKSGSWEAPDDEPAPGGFSICVATLLQRAP